jgi:hypothetical protein
MKFLLFIELVKFTLGDRENYFYSPLALYLGEEEELPCC